MQINKFNDIYAITEELEKKEKGDLFETFTYNLFKYDPRLNNNLKNIWMYKDIPNKILKLLNLPTKDKGIDLIAEINNEYYAIQCKFRQDPNKIINWSELSTFFGLSFGMNNKIKKGFLVTNTHELCDEVINSDKVEAIYSDYFDSLPKTFFKCMNEKKVIKYKSKTPYEHQLLCTMLSVGHFNNNDRGHLEMACGSGKTLTSYWIDKDLDNKKTIIFVPSLYLLSQFYTDWINQSYADNNKINYLLIGSDADIDEETKYKSNGLILMTDVDEIKKHMKKLTKNDISGKHPYVENKIVIICTYQSSDRLIEACENITFDFAVFDEAHKTVGKVNKKFSLALDDDNIKINKRLFMTATPKIYKGNLEDEDIISMDDEKYYGELIWSYNTGNAINDNKLVDYCVMTIHATNKNIKDDIKKNKLIKYKDEFEDEEANYLGTILVLLKKMHDGTCNHMITYHNKVKNAKKFAEFLEKINNILYDDEIFVDYLDGSTSMNKRRKIIKDFEKSKMGIICSARVLNEGVNIPIVDSVCFVDPRFSTIDIVQCIGRSLRLYEGKKKAHIIVPIFIDSFDDDFDKDDYGNIMRILKSLKSTDDGVIEYFNLRSEKKKIRRKICKNEYYDKDIEDSKEIDIEKWEEEISCKIWKVVDSFMYMYNKVKSWVDEHDKIPSSMSKNLSEKKLGQWCSKLRIAKKKNKLIDKKIKLLNKIQKWYWGDNNIKKFKTFDEFLNELKIWFNNNDKNPSDHSENEIEKKLGQWCSRIRKDKKNGALSDEKIKLFKQFNNWFWNQDDVFMEKYDNLKIWTINNKKIPSHGSKNIIEKKLGKLCSGLRSLKKKGKLSDDKIKLLEKIPNWYWDQGIKKNTFEEMHTEVKNWIAIYDKIPALNKKNKLEDKLGRWCAKYRYLYNKEELNDDKIILLNKLPHWFWNFNYTFEEMYDRIKQWVKIHKQIPRCSSKNKIEKELSNWCNTQRQNKKKNTLDDEKILLLKNIDGWFWDHDDNASNNFTKKYNNLKIWMKDNNKLPSTKSKNKLEKQYAGWCKLKRKENRDKKLSNVQIKSLENLKFWHW
jgi:superfamily II DNA or RNA helicase